MKIKFLTILTLLTSSIFALEDYTVYYTGPMDEINKNTPEEIQAIREEIKNCTLSYKNEKELDKCIALDKELRDNNPYL